ncbi:hypothetical protein E2C01_006813 [Portunus trituberculatus]|uniref:Uncharacterized protein n=1 Tax=Portunus trituberculatus TaxID=210409 RepID=A0A5B7CXB5_PORTR|nr:hypothetical protein [Portunus trituberculatus]
MQNETVQEMDFSEPAHVTKIATPTQHRPAALPLLLHISRHTRCRHHTNERWCLVLLSGVSVTGRGEAGREAMSGSIDNTAQRQHHTNQDSVASRCTHHSLDSRKNTSCGLEEATRW